MLFIQPQKFLDHLEVELQSLSESQRVVFGKLVCERHMPEYRAFSVQYEWGSPRLLEDAIRFAEIHQMNRAVDRSEAEDMLQGCVDATPDTDDFDTVLVDYALSSAIMVHYLIQYLIDRDVKSISSIASLARDLVDAKVQFEGELAPNDPDLEFKIANSSLMQAELAALEQLLIKARNAV